VTGLRWFVAGMLTVRTVDVVADHGLGTLAVFTVAAVYVLTLLVAGLARLDRENVL